MAAGYGEKPSMDPASYKEALLRKRGEILSTGGMKPLQTSMETNTRQGDLADQADRKSTRLNSSH